MVLEVERSLSDLIKRRLLRAYNCYLILFHRLTKFTPAHLVVFFCAIILSKLISMRDELGEWTIKGELPIHGGKMIE